VAVFLSLVGSICFVLGAWLFARRLRVQFFGLVATGRIVGHETREADDSIFYLPVVIYIDARGKQHQFTSVAGGTSKSKAASTRVTVRYLLENPKQAYVSGFLHMWAAPAALCVLGAVGVLPVWYR
jgi:hypothetical protein